MKMVVEFEDIRREFTKLRKQAEDALAQVEETQLFAAPTPESNSLAAIMKHLAGNMRSRWTDFLTSDGEKPDRDRDAEFEISAADDAAALFAAWRHGWDCLFAALDALGPEDGEREVLIRGEALTAMQAIVRQLTHYAGHVGQIVYLARILAGAEWRTLSIPRGGSRAFNASPKPYLKPDEPR